MAKATATSGATTRDQAREAEVERGHADRAVTTAARATTIATTSRSDADRAAKHALSIDMKARARPAR